MYFNGKKMDITDCLLQKHVCMEVNKITSHNNSILIVKIGLSHQRS